ncbi:MAG: succinate dehydrogenase assembly factor 2 [Gammaproteobacteria bacterium]|nr:succinate dehydrogenase assembly factor 2 [Gammaproteobacteria bacterium]
MSGDEDLRRVRWRCRRGLLELDLILLRFVDECYPALPQAEKSGFQELLSLPDATLLDYLAGRDKPADKVLREIVRKIR